MIIKAQRGYIAITTSIILAILIMAVAISFGSSNIFTRFNVLDLTSKQTSYFVARSCLNRALLSLADNSNYSGNETIDVSSYQCVISPIETSGANKIIKSRAQISGATTNLKLTVGSSNLSTVSLEELVKF